MLPFAELRSKRTVSVRLLIASALTLSFVMVLCRGVILLDDAATLSLPKWVFEVCRATLSDWALCWGLALLFLLVIQSTQRHRAVARAFAILSLLLAGLAVGNIAAVKMLGGPVTMQWLVFSDVSHSSYMFDTLRTLATPLWTAAGLGAVLGYGAAVVALTRAIPMDVGSKRSRVVLPVTLATATAFFAIVSSLATGAPRTMSNPVLAFVNSAIGPASDTSRFFGNTDDAGAGWQPAESFTKVLPAVTRPDTSAGKVRNVVLYLMESTAARFVSGYDPSVDVTPVIASLAPSSLKVTNAYAHAPASSYSLVGLLAAIIPELSPYGMADNRPDFQFEGLASVLAARGYRTGFFSASDNRFQDAGGFAARAGFQSVEDSRDWPCEGDELNPGYSGPDALKGADDHCMIPPVLSFVDAANGQPFFAMLWTEMAHYPYFPGPNPKTYVADASKNRYMNAVRQTDSALGQLVQGLKDRGLLDSTLIVLLGDHGEAFGEHGQYIHGTEIYEENIRIPLYFVNASLFSGQTADRIVGVSDVAPTILDLLGIRAPDSWQGRSVFAANRPDAVFFFTAWNDMKIGFREGNTKFVLNANTQATRLFNLAVDPGERHDLSASDPEGLKAAKEKLAAWIRLHEHRTAVALGLKKVIAQTGAPTDEIAISASGTKYEGPPRLSVRIDGVDVGEADVTGAVSNADKAVDFAQVASRPSDYSLHVNVGSCPRLVELEFLNDDWAGPGKTGDTNVFITSVTVAGKTYFPWQFKLKDPGIGNEDGGVFYIWKAGRVEVPLQPSPTCIIGGLGSKG